MSQRDISLDIIRILSCLLVVAIHATPSADDFGTRLVAYVLAPCIGLFFMVSGSLLLPVKNGYFEFLQHRFGKVLGPTVCWTLIYLAVRQYYTPDYIDLVKRLGSIPFSAQGHGVLWFMYTLIGLYLLSPILSAWLDKASKKDLQFVLLLWALTTSYPIIDGFVYVDESIGGIFYYFGGYAGYFLLGYYLKKYPDSLSTLVAACIFVLGAMALCVTSSFDIPINFYRTFWYLSIFVVSMCVVIWKSVFKLMSRYSIKNIRLLTRISKLTFGVYLCHMLIKNELIGRIAWISGLDNIVVQSLVVFIFTLALSFALCELLSRLPFARYLTGYKYSKS